ncbi:regenerating islet-derived protein 3-beta-like [Trichosurus vulpecula]|uniref:regenerating islet-derived protein 3-beta-like n=1 Tax=Trichosurus vulpecula TaxID=9337 RepID=UPI00186B2D15|nr:regenerating islet-derived protein 3-beta-like [Trichosurus vulpecula]
MQSTEATVEDVPIVTASSRIACPEGSKIYGSYCYGLFHIPETWYDAERNCQHLPLGHLASLTNEAEASFVASMIAENGGSREAIWVGLHNPLKNRWRWSSNALFTYQAWDINAPSINSDLCVSLTKGSGFLRWNDAECENKFSYICKFIARK